MDAPYASRKLLAAGPRGSAGKRVGATFQLAGSPASDRVPPRAAGTGKSESLKRAGEGAEDALPAETCGKIGSTSSVSSSSNEESPLSTLGGA